LKQRLSGKLKRLLSVPTNDVDLVRAQFQAFAKQIPLLYFILATNAMAVAFTFAKFGPPWITLYVPTTLFVVCLVRGVTWWRIGRSKVPDADAIRHMRRTNRLAFIIAIAYTAWGFALFPYGDAYAQGQIVFFLALTMISCNFCLMHLRPAVLNVTFVGVVPFSIFFFFADQGHFRAAAVNLAFVAFGMITMLMSNYRDFANLVASRRSLIEKQMETQSDENLRLANLDSLSGLPNRRALMTALSERCGDRAKTGAPTAVVFIDLDGFKDVNDTYGHETGDQLIAVVAQDFKRLLPGDALLARIGGDEFAASISATDALQLAHSFASIVIEFLERPIRIGERPIQVGASIGVACAAPTECSADELFRRADTAMYHVKANGKSGVKLYTPELDAERQKRQQIEDQLRRGLAENEFDVVYQPIVDAGARRIVAVEALLRWPRRKEGALSPDQFIPVAEASGLINPLGLFILRRACEELRDIEGIRLNVNVSPAQFRDPDFETQVTNILSQTRFPAKRLELELTEGYLIDHPQRATIAISFLKAMGVSIALDDFGTGYTSIAYLQQYGFNRIKIDKSLAGKITTDRKAGVLVAGAVHLANGLDMAVTAEGVETEEQAAMLKLVGCNCLQGFLFSKPKPLCEALRSEWMEEQRAANVA